MKSYVAVVAEEGIGWHISDNWIAKNDISYCCLFYL